MIKRIIKMIIIFGILTFVFCVSESAYGFYENNKVLINTGLISGYVMIKRKMAS